MVGCQDCYGPDEGHGEGKRIGRFGRGRVENERAFYAWVVGASHSLSDSHFRYFDFGITPVLLSSKYILGMASLD